MFPVALAVTAGIIADRYHNVPLRLSLLVTAVSLLAWLVVRRTRHRYLPLIYLAIALVALGAAHHHYHRNFYPADDIGNFASSEPRPVRLRGVIVEEPIVVHQVHDKALQSMELLDPMVGVLEVTRLKQASDWLPVSGRAQLIVGEEMEGLHAGDEVEVVGRLMAPSPAANPGETDYAAELQDHRIRALVLVRKTSTAVTRVVEGWPRSVSGWLGSIRSWGHRTLQKSLEGQRPKRPTAAVAMALLLGEGTAMTSADWEKYRRTGVIHALAISGWHLVILAAFLWWVLRSVRVRRRFGAVGVALFLLAYAWLTGGRPPAMRAAVTACVYCGGILLGRPSLPANALALGWLAVAALNPADLFTGGCQLSFLAVAILYWGVDLRNYLRPDSLQQSVEESRPSWLRLVRRLLRKILEIYALGWLVWLASTPLVAFHYHLIPPVALLIAPVAILLTTVALLAGFLLLCAAAVCGPVVPAFALVTHWSLVGCEVLVDQACRLPASHRYVADIPAWWVCVFYAGLLSALLLESLRRRPALLTVAGLGWLCFGLAVGWARPVADELRCTFLAVGHGGSTVLETPDGRVLLYDAGAMSGPEVTRRQIAPFLWSRGIRRVDEVILSHADLDHFNGLPDLLERFAVGQVTCTPTFADKNIPGVGKTLDAIQRYRVPVRIVQAGDLLTAGPVTLDVLHPPDPGPPGKENYRSMVLLVRHAGHSILLTGDLEGQGLARVVGLPLPPIDVLMAPHHGSRAGDAREVGNRTQLALLTRPQVIVSCQGLPKGSPDRPNPYQASGAPFLGTWPHGAVTIRSQDRVLTVETFGTKQRWTLTDR